MKKNNPQDKGWTRHFRDDKGVWEDICPHGVGHEKGVHGCDGCCGVKVKDVTPKSPTASSGKKKKMKDGGLVCYPNDMHPYECDPLDCPEKEYHILLELIIARHTRRLNDPI